MSNYRFLLKISCPFCNAQMTAYKTNAITKDLTEVSYRCRNLDCQGLALAAVHLIRVLREPIGWTKEEAEQRSGIMFSERIILIEHNKKNRQKKQMRHFVKSEENKRKKQIRAEEEKFKAAQLDIFKDAKVK